MSSFSAFFDYIVNDLRPKSKQAEEAIARAAKFLKPSNYTCTLTFGERAENHAGMQLLGEEVKDGFTLADLKAVKKKFEDAGAECELINLNKFYQVDDPNAYVLIIRKGVNYLTKKGADALFLEQFTFEKDTKALMRGRVVNKLARYNVCFGEKKQIADIESGKGTIIKYSSVPILKEIREKLKDWFGPKADRMWCEGNYYYDSKKCGIGFHGDSERKRVIAIRLGDSIPLHYQWYLRFKPVGKRCCLQLDHGDVYIMAEKAVGTDWKKSSILTLRHAAGAPKYLK